MIELFIHNHTGTIALVVDNTYQLFYPDGRRDQTMSLWAPVEDAWTPIPGYSMVPWLKCAECNGVSFDDFLCPDCRLTSS